jgi:hypothetical protein
MWDRMGSTRRHTINISFKKMEYGSVILSDAGTAEQTVCVCNHKVSYEVEVAKEYSHRYNLADTGSTAAKPLSIDCAEACAQAASAGSEPSSWHGK